MADLMVDEATLAEVASTVSGTVVDIEVTSEPAGASAADLGAATVAGEFDELVRQLQRRSELTIDAVGALADFPTRFVSELDEAEARLAAGASVGDPAGAGTEPR